MEKAKIKVYTYTRVSTAMQVDGYSLDAQKARMKAFADFNNYEIVGEYEDAGKSGRSIEGRVQFNQMIEDIKSDKDGVSYVLVFKLSRFGRNAADVLSSLQTMQVRTITGSRETLPPDWLIHPDLGVLPCNFIDAGKVEELFGSPKEYHTRLVKEYESAVKIARTLGEEVEFSQSEIRDIVNTELRASYPGRLFKSLSPEEKCRVAVRLYETMRLDTRMMAQALYLSELTIIQAIRSKDYGIH